MHCKFIKTFIKTFVRSAKLSILVKLLQYKVELMFEDIFSRFRIYCRLIRFYSPKKDHSGAHWHEKYRKKRGRYKKKKERRK